MSDKAALTIGLDTYEVPVIKGTLGPDVLDVRKLYADSDRFTFDPGFTSTASCESKITYIAATPACCCTAGTRSNSSPRRAPSSRSAIYC